ncbi:hypothetical protein BDN70DRAFT_991646 [Pholiota conissans]|uniref:Uncharacterized protein n=1 Tax=Pholiota conissans TaxID=109636 RepID=A0A9P5Z859_9AGAR|nr:hypothetical protein BDN70DRAFT_991646 [Pholiota conissans]
MSAKQFYHKDVPPNLPYLPPEIWTTIIQHATYVSGGYDPDVTTLALGLSAGTMNKEPLDIWKKSMVTRRSLVLVSKAWYILASPFLYEYILLGRGKAVLPLLLGMQRSKEAVGGDTVCPIGWWTKRLDVNLRDSTDKPRADIDALGNIMTHLPNLRVLTFSITGHRYQRTLSPKVLWSVSCRDTLKFVHFYTTCLPSAEAWTVFLQNHPNLESLNLNEISKAGRHPLTMQFDSLKVVHIHALYPIEFVPKEYLRNVWDYDLPSVRTATYELEFSNNDDLPIERIFTKHGPKLTTLQLTQIYQITDMELEAAMQVTFSSIFAHCDALEQINLIVHSWSMLTLDVPRFPPKVATLVIRVIKGQISKKATVHLFDIFIYIKRRNPGLKTIRFASGINVRGLQTHSVALEEGLWIMRDAGVVIEDHYGCALN